VERGPDQAGSRADTCRSQAFAEGWPNGAKVAVCLSFDVDYEAGDLARNAGVPVPLSAREYGAVLGLPRILTLLDQHDAPASFYISAVDAMLHPESVQDIVSRNRKHHEVGVKGWMQENLVALNDESVEQRLLNQAIEHLTKVSGRRPVGYRAPGGAFSRFTLGQIVKAGFLYDSSMMAMDDPYEIVSNGRATGLVELPVVSPRRRALFHAQSIAAVPRTDFSGLPRRVRYGPQGRRHAHADDAPAHHRTSLSRFRAPGEVRHGAQIEARRLVRHRRAGCYVREGTRKDRIT
jgi:peptidoglycan/xylan/chitin deacetylase (PgdA/CDA1 family)